ncbi:hypothetical protein JF66_16835 [Cryobacterium sp. MLB-32]|uniref:hypothetical protein n=1 Tax=Cryobacterium sp. MLB-32 TaxID=1529318 RepID=UPI0004E76FE0|nr:hypothetical protein [Cryobacterium sp. MLB-32]KFF58676.1 hypothetical protein JF66_16835 [Cryobacterium sp. MLB-32]
MEKKTKIIGAGVALTLALIGGTTLTAGALTVPAAPASSTSNEESGTSAVDTDNVQNEVKDGTADESGTESATEKTSDDINGVAVEDGTQD